MRKALQLTLLPEDSPVRTSPSPAAAPESTGPGPASGARCDGSSPSADLVGSLLRTSLLSELGALTGSSLIWKDSATPQRRSWLVLTTRERPTADDAPSCWPTATATDAKASGSRAGTPRASASAKAHPGTSLTDAVQGLWITPTRRDYKDSSGMSLLPRADGASRVDLLPRQVFALERGEWPTPTAVTYGYNRGGAAGRVGPIRPSLEGLARSEANGRPDPASSSESGKSRGSLNARWVQQLMGFPDGWTDLGTERRSRLWATRSSRKSSPPSGGRSSR